MLAASADNWDKSGAQHTVAALALLPARCGRISGGRNSPVVRDSGLTVQDYSVYLRAVEGSGLALAT